MMDLVGAQVIRVARPEWILPIAGLRTVQFRRLVRLVVERGGSDHDGRPGLQWAFDPADRMLLVFAYGSVLISVFGPVV